MQVALSGNAQLQSDLNKIALNCMIFNECLVVLSQNKRFSSLEWTSKGFGSQ